MPPNPLNLAAPGNPAIYYDQNGRQRPESGFGPGDYTLSPTRDQAAEIARTLPLFGYNFFQSSRRIIDARRAYLQRRYTLTPPTGDLPAGNPRNRPGVRPLLPNTPAVPNVMTPTSGADFIPGMQGAATFRLADDVNTATAFRLADSVNGDPSAGNGMSDSAQSETGLGGAAQNSADGIGGEQTGTLNGYAPPVAGGAVRGGQPGLGPQGDLNTNGTNGRGELGGSYQGSYPASAPMNGDSTALDASHEVADPLSELYRNVNATVPATYQLSSGDILTVRYWSPTMEPREVTVTVDAQEAIIIPGIGRLVVRGLTSAQAEHVLRERARRLYNGADVSVTLKEPRTISVTVSGEAYAPGTYNVPAVSTAFNVLYAAGGPTENGSLRAIEVRRAGRLIGKLDVYKLLLGSGSFADIPLQPGDLISVVPRLSRVAVEGEVREPAIYELAPGETLRDALRFARGVKPSGVAQHVEVNTLRPGSARVLKDVNLTDKAVVATLPLYDGDIVNVFSLRNILANSVTVDGAVDQPGDYALTAGMRISDLVERARGPIEEAYTTRADLFRWNPNNTTTLVPINLDRALAKDPSADLLLSRWDRLRVYTRQQVAWTGQRHVTVRGAVQRPGVYTRSDRMHARDLLLQAGGPTPEASLNRVVLLHQSPSGSFDYHYVNLAPDSTDDPLLQDDDVLAVYTAREAQFTANHVVTILGQVVAPGPYPRGDGMRLSDLLKLAGGFRPDAATHVSIAHAYKAIDDPTARPVAITAMFDAQHNSVPGEDVTLQDGDVVTVQGTGGFRDHVAVVTINGAVNHPGPVILTDKMRLSDAIRAAGGLRDVAYPRAAEFTRQPALLTTGEQRNLSQVINRLNDLLNQSTYRRELAKSDIEKVKALQNANSSSPLIPLAGLSGSTAAPQTTATPPQFLQRDLTSAPRVLAAADLEPGGNLAVNFTKALKQPGSVEDIPLLEGDTITVPERPTTVQVVGAVFESRGVLYKPGASLQYYLDQAGGVTNDAAKDRIEVIQADGGISPGDRVHSLQPGDLILVPTKVLAEKISRSGNAFTDFFSGLASTAILVKVLSSVL